MRKLIVTVKALVKTILRKIHLLDLVNGIRKNIKRIVYYVQRFFSSLVFALFPQLGILKYSSMQKKEYKWRTNNYEAAKNLCVGSFNDQESYPYNKYLLERYSSKTEYALDFGCGMGRMMNRMLNIFPYVDGADLMQENLNYASRYLTSENQINQERYNLFLTDGRNCKISPIYKYDFIYSTICLQHIPVYKIRFEIFHDLYQLLNINGQCCFQMVFGYDNGVHWFHNEYMAPDTNGALDVSIPDESHFPMIEKDFKLIGFRNVEFIIKESPHAKNAQISHLYWIFIHLWK